jgi:hypothetical protein
MTAGACRNLPECLIEVSVGVARGGKVDLSNLQHETTVNLTSYLPDLTLSCPKSREIYMKISRENLISL